MSKRRSLIALDFKYSYILTVYDSGTNIAFFFIVCFILFLEKEKEL